MVFQCWPNVCNAGATLKRHQVNTPCLVFGGQSVAETFNHAEAVKQP